MTPTTDPLEKTLAFIRSLESGQLNGVKPDDCGDWEQQVKEAIRNFNLDGPQAALKGLYAAAPDLIQLAAGGIEPLPAVKVNARPLRDVSADAFNALLAKNNPPAVFVRAGALTRVKVDEQGQPTTEIMSVAAVKGELERAADFFRRKRIKDENGKIKTIDTPCPLPQDYVKDIMALPQWAGIPPLVGITTAPTFAPDGTLNTESRVSSRYRSLPPQKRVDRG